MASTVYLARETIDQGGKPISKNARKRFTATYFPPSCRENDLAALKIHVAEHGFSHENLSEPVISPDALFSAAETPVTANCHLYKEVLGVAQMRPNALALLDNKKATVAFFDFLFAITGNCDCFNDPKVPKIVRDIGIAASTDTVALDKASIDLVQRAGGKQFGQLLGKGELNYHAQIEHAVAIGLGYADYDLAEID